MELLAPAGSEAALVAAVQSGADAVYLGGSMFSARRTAKNFSDDDMKSRIDYCHVRGTDVHVAANILVKEKESDEFIEYIEKINKSGADALIIQDIGMAAEIKKRFPDLPLHASTQMTAASLDAVKYLENMGFSRVVLSRELSRREIEYICKNAKAEIEVFVHGALCMCYSGQCLMSSVIGGRSGNRGLCAQPCRLAYDMTDGKNILAEGYLLSPKDNALADEISALKDIGVTSLKIEGRLKRPEYVAQVTGVYRRLIDTQTKPNKSDWSLLEGAFNRSGFTKGYFTEKKGHEMMSVTCPGNTSENKFTSETVQRAKIDANYKKITIDLFFVLKKGKTAELTMTDCDFNSVTVSGELLAEAAEKRALTKDRVREQLLKLGNTPFSAGNLEIILDEDISLPISEINNIRRHAAELLEQKRCERPARRVNYIEETACKAKILNTKLFSAEVRNLSQAKAVLKYDIPILYVPEELAEEVKAHAPERKVITVLPPVWKQNKIRKYKAEDGVLVSNVGQLTEYSEYECYGGARLNIFNSKSIEHFSALKSVCVSPELNLKEIRSLHPSAPLEVIAYGRLPLMVMENCPVKANGACGKKTYLRDRKKENFPLVCAPACYCELLNSKPLYMADKFSDLKELPASIYKLNFTTESPAECEAVIIEYMRAMSGEKVKNTLEENSFTRGHYYRGVE